MALKNVPNRKRKGDRMGEEQERLADIYQKTVQEELRVGEWAVYEKYQIIEDEGHKFVRAPLTAKQRRERQIYKPLSRRSADLFLRFAAWPNKYDMDHDAAAAESEKNQEAALRWARTYGVLGANRSDVTVVGISAAAVEDYLGRPGPDRRAGRGWENNALGGYPDESVARFVAEALEARMIRQLYEAATAGPKPDHEGIVALMSSRSEGWGPELSWPSTRESHGNTLARAHDWALTVVEETVQRKLQKHSHLTLTVSKGSYQEGRAFHSLLGAMWMQMLYLMCGSARVCELPGCNRILSLDESEQSTRQETKSPKRKTPKHKRFCSDGHRVEWNREYGTGKSRRYAKNRTA
jgi:hypothetical protein